MEKSLLQTFTSANNWYSLQYPKMWEVEIVDNIPAFYDPLFGKGSLQIMGLQLGNSNNLPEGLEQIPFLKGANLLEKMQLFLDSQHISYNNSDLTETARGESKLIAHEYSVEKRFYMVCMMQNSNTLVLSLYNCSDAPEQEEAMNVGQIINSIKILK